MNFRQHVEDGSPWVLNVQMRGIAGKVVVVDFLFYSTDNGFVESFVPVFVKMLVGICQQLGITFLDIQIFAPHDHFTTFIRGLDDNVVPFFEAGKS